MKNLNDIIENCSKLIDSKIPTLIIHEIIEMLTHLGEKRTKENIEKIIEEKNGEYFFSKKFLKSKLEITTFLPIILQATAQDPSSLSLTMFVSNLNKNLKRTPAKIESFEKKDNILLYIMENGGFLFPVAINLPENFKDQELEKDKNESVPKVIKNLFKNNN